jgi:hypothetical protein
MSEVLKAAAGLLLLLVGCEDQPQQWDAFVYPDTNHRYKFEKIAGFKSFELCHQAAINKLRTLPNPNGGDFECGYMCGPDYRNPGMNVCKETRK